MNDVNKLVNSFNENAHICPLLDEIKMTLAARHIEIISYTSESLEIFNRLPGPKKASIIQNLADYVSILRTRPADKERPKISREEEIEYIQIALSKFRLKQKGGANLSFFQENDLIEIYSTQGIQLYRNFEFFKQCSYDLLSVISNEWHVLYERAQLATTGIFDMVSQTLQSGTGVTPYNLPTHTLRERYLNAKNIFSVTMKYVCPLVDESTSEVAGFLHTVGSELILSGSSSDKIVHL